MKKNQESFKVSSTLAIFNKIDKKRNFYILKKNTFKNLYWSLFLVFFVYVVNLYTTNLYIEKVSTQKPLLSYTNGKVEPIIYTKEDIRKMREILNKKSN